MLAHRLRTIADRLLDSAGEVFDRSPRLARWRNERFYAQVEQRLPVVGVDAAHGTRYFVHPRDPYIGGGIMRMGVFQPENVSAALALLRHHGQEIAQLLDIGANIGTTTIEILRQMPGVVGVAFEPGPANFQLLRMNLIANELDHRVRPMQIALTDESGPVPFELSSYNLGDHRIHLGSPAGQNAFDEEGRDTITVPGLRLDDVTELEVDQNTLLFVDVQGFEGQVLAGAPRALRACPPLVVELWPYGLDRAGGRQALFDGLARYERFYDLKACPPRLLRHDELPTLAASISGNPLRDTDILALGR